MAETKVLYNNRNNSKGRVQLLDNLRGFSVLSMVVYHAMFNVVYIFGHDIPWYRGTPGFLWQQSICWVFILVSGASLHYGRHPVRRGLVVAGSAVLVTLVTYFFMPSQLILFGILHCLAVCMLVFGALRRVLQKVPPVLGLVVSFGLFALFTGVPRGYLGVFGYALVELPRSLYTTSFLYPLGLPGPTFQSGDYFALLPWMLLYLAGFYAWALLKGRAKPTVQRGNPLAFVGRHSLVIYLLHQPLTYGIMLGLDALGWM